MIAAGAESSSMKKKMILWAKGKGKKGTEAKING